MVDNSCRIAFIIYTNATSSRWADILFRVVQVSVVSEFVAETVGVAGRDAEMEVERHADSPDSARFASCSVVPSAFFQSPQPFEVRPNTTAAAPLGVLKR